MAGVTCPRCGTVSASQLRVCLKCGTSLSAVGKGKAPQGTPAVVRKTPAPPVDDAGATMDGTDEPPSPPPSTPPRAKAPPSKRAPSSRAPGVGEPSSGGRDPLVGQKLQEYVIEARIGSGGMGYVYRAVQPMIGKHVAIKVLRGDVVADPRDIERLLDEARVVNSIKHRGIINIFGAGSLDDGRHYLIMELLEGEPLDQVMKREGFLPAADAVIILEQVLSAIAAAHAAGIVHRDLKPANIFLVKEGTTHYVKLLDFGLARRKQDQVTRIAGTPDYISPEHARGRPAGPPADLYAFGVLCFHMLIGRLPFVGTTPMEVMEQHVNSAPEVPHELNPAIPKALSELILKLLAKEPGERPDAEQVKADLRAATKQLRAASTMLSLVGVEAVKPAKPKPAAKERRATREVEAPASAPKTGSKWPLLIAVALLLLAAAAVGAIALLNKTESESGRPRPTLSKVPDALSKTATVTPLVPKADPVEAPPPTTPVQALDAGETTALEGDEPTEEADASVEPDAPKEDPYEIRDDVYLGEWRRAHGVDDRLETMNESMRIDRRKREYFASKWQLVKAQCDSANTKATLLDCDDELQDLVKNFYKE